MNEWNVGVYIRLSQEDGDKEESNSVTNQRELINNYIEEEKDLVVYDYYIDDGWSGTNFDRPDFKRLIEDVESGIINTIIVKDLSRFGRNYIEVGRFLEDTFPTMRIRFISIIDSFKNPESSSSMLVNFKNLINDEYARDISKKTKAALNVRKKKGDYVAGSVPFGYKRDETNKYQLVIDEESANIVKMIFELARENKGTFEISNYINERLFSKIIKIRSDNKHSLFSGFLLCSDC